MKVRLVMTRAEEWPHAETGVRLATGDRFVDHEDVFEVDVPEDQWAAWKAADLRLRDAQEAAAHAQGQMRALWDAAEDEHHASLPPRDPDAPPPGPIRDLFPAIGTGGAKPVRYS